MKKSTKLFILLASAALNIVFFLLCGYGKVQQPDTADFLDPALGAIAVSVLSYGESRFLPQIYFRYKYKELQIRTFDLKFWRQCITFVAYYAGSLLYLSVAESIYSSGYLAIFAIVLCPLWMFGSRTLWTGEAGEDSFYLDESVTWYEVRDVMENDDVVEIKCKAPEDRERVISIAKKKQELNQ